MSTEQPISNPPAFPVSTIDGYNNDGMELRDYFAAKAMQGIISNNYYSMIISGNTELPEPKYLSEFSYQIADAMLIARTKQQ